MLALERRTPEGKQAAKWNSLRHGLRAETRVLPDEDLKEFERFRQSLCGELEAVLVERIVILAWRLRRVGQIEAGIFTRHHYQELSKRAADKASQYNASIDLGELLMRVERDRRRQSVQPAVAAQQAEQEAQDAAAQILAASRPLLSAFDGPTNTLANVSRYETTLERSLFKALHELERLQARRAGQPIAPPAVLDVNLDVHQDGLS